MCLASGSRSQAVSRTAHTWQVACLGLVCSTLLPDRISRCVARRGNIFTRVSFARLLRSPSSPVERLLGRLIALGNPFFQIESLYRLNAKFFPRWEPRYLVCEGTFGLPRAGLAAIRAEGLLPTPKLPQRSSRQTA